ncbi:hypothetical protein Y032_0470g2034 [Ancylostoma ceylanicum]|uniref:Uncharacterized protein n=1 Tax=Ancylostoma ceylanicum TaxID=53326 RepID=A0A016WWY0_9BILA|nr:hypothetical protein Y032_0470g2034 [Ancylostoma ceylanicum]
MKVQLLTEGSKRLFSKGQVITKLYQVRENLKTMETLFLFFLISCFVSFASNAFRGVVHYYKRDISQPTYIGLIELSIPIPPYSLVLPAVLWYSYRKVRRKRRQQPGWSSEIRHILLWCGKLPITV